jgi:hypothetical protein
LSWKPSEDDFSEERFTDSDFDDREREMQLNDFPEPSPVSARKVQKPTILMESPRQPSPLKRPKFKLDLHGESFKNLIKPTIDIAADSKDPEFEEQQDIKEEPEPLTL